MKFNEEEKRIVEEQCPYGLTDPYAAVEDALIRSHYLPDDNKEFVDIMFNCAKKILIEVAKERGIEADFTESFAIDEIITNNEGLSDLKPEDYKDLNKLKEYVNNKTKDMNYSEVDKFSKKFGEHGSFTDIARTFMEKYIERISETFRNLDAEILYKEIEDEAGKEDQEFDPFKESDNENNVERDAWEEEQFDGNDSERRGEDPNEWELDEEEDTIATAPSEDKPVSNEELLDFIKYLNSSDEIINIKNNFKTIYTELVHLSREKEVKVYKDNKEFYSELENIMKHDSKKNQYLFHGVTAVSRAESILKQGLGIGSDKLQYTTYTFSDYDKSIENVLLYKRGYGDEIGKDAIVIIDQPIDENGELVNIVRPVTDEDVIDFQPSGLNGLNGKAECMIEKQYIVGFINKADMEITYNEAYYDYERFSKQKDDKSKTISAKEGLRNAISKVGLEDVDKANKDMNVDIEKAENKDI